MDRTKLRGIHSEHYQLSFSHHSHHMITWAVILMRHRMIYARIIFFMRWIEQNITYKS